MGSSLTGSASALIAAVFNLSLAALFLNALLNPAQNIDFIFSMSFLVLIVEFLSIHSSGMLAGARIEAGSIYFLLEEIIRRIWLLIIYIGFVALLCWELGHWELLLIFALSTIAKALMGADAGKGLALQVKLLCVTLTLAIILAPFLQGQFPIGPEVLAQRPNATFDIALLNVPQALLAWGVAYYAIIALLDLWKAASPLLGKREKAAHD